MAGPVLPAPWGLPKWGKEWEWADWGSSREITPSPALHKPPAGDSRMKRKKIHFPPNEQTWKRTRIGANRVEPLIFHLHPAAGGGFIPAVNPAASSSSFVPGNKSRLSAGQSRRLPFSHPCSGVGGTPGGIRAGKHRPHPKMGWLPSLQTPVSPPN